MDDDDFLVRPGARPSVFASNRPRYLGLVLQQVARLGGFARPQRRYIGRGRGGGCARVLALGNPCFGLRSVRVAPRIVRVQGKLAAAQQHLRYIARDGVGRDTLHGRLYDATTDRADGRGFMSRTRADGHQFRIVVAVEDGWEYPSLRSFTRRLLKDMEHDLGTELEWIAADHYNTGFPHSHIVLRGIDEQGKELRIARDYLRAGMNMRAALIAGLDLGACDPADPRHRAFANTARLEPSALDAQLEAAANAHGELILAGRGYDSFRHSLWAARLQTLKSLDLAQERRGGRWQLQPNLRPTLEALATRSLRLALLDHEINRHGLIRTARERAIFDPTPDVRAALVGRLLGQGGATDGRGFVVLDCVDGRSYFVDLGQVAGPTARDGAIVAVRPQARGPGAEDQAIAQVAGAFDGRYAADLHQALDPALDVRTIERCLQRLRLLALPLDLREEGSQIWRVGRDFLTRLRRFAEAQARLYPVKVEVLSNDPLERAITMTGPSWLDHVPALAGGLALSARGFGRQLQDALAVRRQCDPSGPSTAREHGEEMGWSYPRSHGRVKAPDRERGMQGGQVQARGDLSLASGDAIRSRAQIERCARSISR